MKNFLAGFLSIALVTASFSACSGNTASSSGAGTSSNPDKAPASVAESGASSSSPDNEVTKIVIAGVTGNAANDLLMAKADQIREEIGLEIEFSVTTFDDYNQKLLTMAAAGSKEIDLCFVEAASTANLVEGGVLEPLQPYFDKYNLSTDVYVPNVIETSGMVNNTLYAVPHTLDCRATIYDQRVLDKLGVEPPKTFEEFTAYCQAASAEGYLPLALRYSLYWTPMYEWGAFLFGHGGSFVVKDNDGWKANLDNEAGAAWIETVRGITATIPGDTLVNMGDAEAYASFNQSQAGCTISGNWFYAEVEPETAANLVSARLPKGPKGVGSPMGGWRLGMFAGSQNKDAAFRLIEWMQKPENAAACVDGLPGTTDAYQYVSKENQEIFKIFLEEMSESGTTITPPGFPWSTQVANALYEPFQAAILDPSIPAAKAAKNCNDAIQRAIDENS